MEKIVSIIAKGPQGRFECEGLKASSKLSELITQLSIKSGRSEI